MPSLDVPPDRQPVVDPTRPRTSLSCRLESLASTGPRPVTVLWVVGEIDRFTQSAAETALDVVLQHAPGAVVVDLAGLTFCSVNGLRLLGGPTATTGGHAYVLAGLSPHLQRATALLWDPGLPVRYPHTAAAVTALRAAHPDTTRAGG